jgi:uncharacterized membrane protein
MRTNKEIISASKASVSGIFGKAILAVLVVGIISGCISIIETATGTTTSLTLNILSILVSVFVAFPLGFGLQNSFLKFCTDSDSNLTANSFKIGFGNGNYFRFIGGGILIALITAAGFILFIIPGIIWMLAYSLTPFILNTHHEIGITEAMTASRKAMKGKKMKLLGLVLLIMVIPLVAIFAGTIIIVNGNAHLGGVFLGIGFVLALLLAPLYYTALANFFMDAVKDMAPEATE